MKKIVTGRLEIVPMSSAELQQLVEQYKDSAPALSQAYQEMLDNCIRQPTLQLWYAPWKLCRGEDVVGYAGFQGLRKDGHTEIGYGIEEAYCGRGYATESVQALCRWAFATGQVTAVEAETEPDNLASQKVLQKSGFFATGKTGEEGPRFLLAKH